MKKYINKTAVVAEIEKFMYEANQEADIASTGECFDEKVADAKYQLCKQIRDSIDSLEVKEADLEKEIQEVQRNYKTIGEYKGYPCTMYADDIEWIAKHFFELGLKAKGE